jgi:hypothetical protein
VVVGTEKVSELIPAITQDARPMAACRLKEVMLRERLLRMVERYQPAPWSQENADLVP